LKPRPKKTCTMCGGSKWGMARHRTWMGTFCTRTCRRLFEKARDDEIRKRREWLAYNLGNFLRTLATPEPIKDWSLTSLKEKLIKIGAKVVSHGRYVAFQMAEVAIPRQMFQEILRLIAELRPQPPPAPA
jgi:hypothetical protein